MSELNESDNERFYESLSESDRQLVAELDKPIDEAFVEPLSESDREILAEIPDLDDAYVSEASGEQHSVPGDSTHELTDEEELELLALEMEMS